MKRVKKERKQFTNSAVYYAIMKDVATRAGRKA